MSLNPTTHFRSPSPGCAAVALLCAGLTSAAHAQSAGPAVVAWKLNLTGETGYNGIVADVNRLRHSAGFMYPTSSGIPDYSIGPWPGNPNTPANQNWTFKITKNPTASTGNGTATALGAIGVLINGVPFFNALDAFSYQNENVWHQNAMYFEGASFDSCKGHPAPGGVYHPHQRPICVEADDPTHHSKIIGFGFDGYPIYGPYGYANADGTGGIVRIETSYRKRNITTRTTLPDGTQLPANLYGPNVSATYPLGAYVEDYEYVAGLGDLDEDNGRFTVTPDYPNGIYAYFASIDATGATIYPYLIGPRYHGIVIAGNTGPGGGHVNPTDSPVDFTGGACPADIDYDRSVGGSDMGVLLSNWGAGGGGGDINRDGDVDGQDLALLLSNWGSCD